MESAISFLLPLFLAAAALLFGKGAVTISNLAGESLQRDRHTPLGGAAAFALGAQILLLPGEAAWLLTMRSGADLGTGVRRFALFFIALGTLCYFCWIGISLWKKWTSEEKPEAEKKPPREPLSPLWIAVPLLLSGVILCLLITGHRVSLRGDLTAETVASAMHTGSLYSVNPMTGMPYTEGIPTRLRILCLPFFYAVLGRVFHISAPVLVWRIFPVFWFLAGLCAWISLSGVCFRDRKKRLLFLSLILLLLFASDAAFPYDGFLVLSAGWTGPAIRAWLLIPSLTDLLLRRKYLLAFLPVLCEGILVWTLFGAKSCALLYAGICLASFLYGRFLKKRGKEGA